MSDSHDPADAGMDNPPDDLIERLLATTGLNVPFLCREAASRLAALQQRVEELKLDVHVAVAHAQSAISDRKGRNDAAAAREQVLREALADLVSECEEYGSPLATGAMERAQAALSAHKEGS